MLFRSRRARRHPCATTEHVFALGESASQNPRMLAEHALPTDLDARVADLGRVWSADPDVAAVYLFGSRAEGRAGPRSDVDLAVVLCETTTPDARWRKRLALIGDASQRLRTDAVDVVVLENAPIVLAHRILSRGRLIGEADPHRRTAVAEQVMRRYLDEAPLRAVLDAEIGRAHV